MVRDQMVGPWQTPVADCAVTASSYGAFTGEAMALGERPPVAVSNAPASGRLAVAEALTNICSARILRLDDVALSANWMAAAGDPGSTGRTVRNRRSRINPGAAVAYPNPGRQGFNVDERSVDASRPGKTGNCPGIA